MASTTSKQHSFDFLKFTSQYIKLYLLLQGAPKNAASAQQCASKNTQQWKGYVVKHSYLSEDVLMTITRKTTCFGTYWPMSAETCSFSSYSH